MIINAHRYDASWNFDESVWSQKIQSSLDGITWTDANTMQNYTQQDLEDAPDNMAGSYDDLTKLCNDTVLIIQRQLTWLVDLICHYLSNVSNLINSQRSLWLLFFQPCTVYVHTSAGVVRRLNLKKVRFVRGMYAVSFVCYMLLGALVLDVVPLSCPGEYCCTTFYIL